MLTNRTQGSYPALKLTPVTLRSFSRQLPSSCFSLWLPYGRSHFTYSLRLPGFSFSPPTSGGRNFTSTTRISIFTLLTRISPVARTLTTRRSLFTSVIRRSAFTLATRMSKFTLTTRLSVFTSTTRRSLLLLSLKANSLYLPGAQLI